MTDTFIHFSPIFFAFLEELAASNNRDWFANNKARYEDEVVSPMVAFIATMGPSLRKISPHFVADPRANGGSMSRICRDVRFSKDKRSYKEHASCHFRHEIRTRDVHTPGYYVHLAPTTCASAAAFGCRPVRPLAPSATPSTRTALAGSG
jgi:uncharacterized protein (TIGR02453 family)